MTASKVVFVHGSVETLVAVHARLVQVFRELAGDAVECLGRGLVAGPHAAVLVTGGPVHGVLLLARVPLHHCLQVPLHLRVRRLQVHILHFGTRVHGVAGVVNRLLRGHPQYKFIIVVD